ncbi:MAG: lysine--tRNA ligase [Alphaproteobacteria bacterium]|nr:lysine--tRNA ligase [Alphaproteobacteria bacterium]
MTEEISEQRQSRLNKLARLEEMGYNPYPYRFRPDSYAKDLQDKYKDLANGEHTEDIVTVAGRAMAVRNDGMFIDMKDKTGNIQLFCHKCNLDEDNLKLLKCLDIGDIVGVTGFIRRTPRGELSVAAQKFDIIAKSLEPLPEKFHGLTDIETRYRKRYVDMIINDEAKNTLITRCKIVSAIREFFNSNEFLEVETPTLHPILGGANAKPFVTHYNALDNDFYLRIAPELYLKKLIIGGIDRVFEIGKNFRNEGIDKNHVPEFTGLEAYMAYGDYNDMAELMTNLLRFVVNKVFGSLKITLNEHEIDFSKPFPKVSIIDLIKRETGVDFLSVENLDDAKALAKSVGVNADECTNWGKVVQEVFDEKVEHTLVEPILVSDMPKEITPLAKTHRDNPRLVEHFDLYLLGTELGCAYSELSNPLEQMERFNSQMKEREAGDDEAQMLDESFIDALSYGFVPTTGMGMGMDRLAKLLTGSATLRDVILFPALKKRG